MSGECKVDKVNPKYLGDAVEKARTLEDVFSSLHILQAGDTVLAPPNRIDPQDPDLAGRYRDISADRWPYLAASRGGFNVANLFSNGANSDALNCALNALQYSEAQGKAVADKIDGMRTEGKNESAVQSYLGGLSAKDQRNYEIYNTLRFMHQFDKGPDTLDKDGDFSVISREDMTNWAEGLGDEGQTQGEKAVVRLHVILGLVNYFANPPAHVLAPATVADAGAPDTGAPNPIVVAVTPPTSGTTPPPPPVTTQPPAPSNDPLTTGIAIAASLVGAGVLGGIATYFVMKQRMAAAPKNNPPDNPPKDSKTDQAPKEKRAEKSEKTEAPKTESKAKAPEAKIQDKPSVDDMSNVLEALSTAKDNQTPASGKKVGGTAPSVTADNILIKGSTAEPVAGLDVDVVRAQVVLHYRHFLSQAAREALQDGKPVPSGADMVNSKYAKEVSAIVDHVMAEYFPKAKSSEGKEVISDLWKSQLEERGYIVRRGVPQRLLIELVNNYISEHSQSAESPFAGGVGATIRNEAERSAGENKFFEDGLREMMRHLGR